MISNYQIIKQIGEGASSNIYLTEDTRDRKQYYLFILIMLI